MAEEGIILPVPPESNKSDGGNSRRHSTGKSTSLNSGEKVLPHYLRASTGSCHDLCKYGRKHAFEANTRHSMPKRIATKPSDDKNPMESPVLPERKKTSVVKLRTSPNSKASIPDTPDIIKCEVSTKAPIKLEVSTKSPDSQNPVENEVVAEKKMKNKTSTGKLRPSPNSRPRFSDNPESMKLVVSSSSEKVGVSPKQASSKVKETSLSAKCPTSSKPKSVMERSLSKKRAPSLKPKSMMETRLSAKCATSLKPKFVMEKPLSSRAGLSGRRNSDIKIEKSTGTTKVAVKKVLASPRAALSPKPSFVRVTSLNARKHRSLKVVSSLKKVVSSLKNQNKIKKAEPDQPIDELKQPISDVVQEKTLYVIKMETENKTLESDEKDSPAVESSLPPSLSSPSSSSLPDTPSSSSRKVGHQEESDYTVTEAEDDSLSEHSETLNMEAETLEEKHEGRSRKVHSEDNDSQPMKLKFRRGKVVDIHSEHNSPRRLRFRQGRVVAENQNVKADGRGSFKRRGVVDGDTTDSKPGSVKVALRHQDVQGKKDAQGLFNNVIEETASKLVETRKSKVKALVGAFETVISLQESKPSANPVT